MNFNRVKKYLLIILLFVTVLFACNSCLNRQFVEGWAEIGSTSDTTLNDSSLIYGHVFRIDWDGPQIYYANQYEICIENSDLITTNDTLGYYSIKTGPGTYTIKCQNTGNVWEKLIEEVKNIELTKNTKTEIDFYIGYTIE
jgi:hypothetical protein